MKICIFSKLETYSIQYVISEDTSKQCKYIYNNNTLLDVHSTYIGNTFQGGKAFGVWS